MRDKGFRDQLEKVPGRENSCMYNHRPRHSAQEQRKPRRTSYPTHQFFARFSLHLAAASVLHVSRASTASPCSRPAVTPDQSLTSPRHSARGAANQIGGALDQLAWLADRGLPTRSVAEARDPRAHRRPSATTAAGAHSRPLHGPSSQWHPQLPRRPPRRFRRR